MSVLARYFCDEHQKLLSESQVEKFVCFWCAQNKIAEREAEAATTALEQAAQKCDDVKNDAQEKLGLVPANIAFENGRSKAANEIKELIAAIGNDKK